MERAVFDEDGQLLTASFLDYCCRAPTICPVRFRDPERAVDDQSDGPQRRRRSRLDRSTPAVMNAVADALWRAYRIEHIDMPATPFAVYSAIKRSGIKG